MLELILKSKKKISLSKSSRNLLDKSTFSRFFVWDIPAQLGVLLCTVLLKGKLFVHSILATSVYCRPENRIHPLSPEENISPLTMFAARTPFLCFILPFCMDFIRS
jgi:hypothetical protein